MDLAADTLMVVITKTAILIGFVALIKLWKRNKKSVLPMVIYWVFGLALVLLMGFTIINWCLSIFSYKEGSVLADGGYSSLSAILGISLYLLIGFKYLKAKK